VKRYQGIREHGAAHVRVNGAPLNPRHDLHNHSPSGFEWGYGGSGPAQLALAILADHLQNDHLALELHQQFKWAVIANLSNSRWILTSEEIDRALDGICAGGLP